MAFRTLLTLIVVIIPSIWCFPDGAPVDACPDMTPQHGEEIKSVATFPFNIVLDKTSVNAGEAVHGSIVGKTATDVIKGFMVQVHDVNNKMIGTFKVPRRDQFVKPLRCPLGNAITHKFIENPQNKIDFVWTAPNTYKGDVTVKVTTVLPGGTDYWVAVPAASAITVS